MQQKMAVIVVLAMSLFTLGAIISNEAALQAQETQSNMLPPDVATEIPTATSTLEEADLVTQEYGPLRITTRNVPPPQVVVDQRELQCLARNVYYEAKGESREGQLAVAFVTVNRIGLHDWKGTVCGVVYQRTPTGRCQFSWVCQGKSQPPESPVWQAALDIARDVLAGRASDPTRNSVFFHNQSVRPRFPNAQRTVVIGNHTFYRTTLASR